MTMELKPNEAAELAFNVYTVNSGDEFLLKTFLKAKIFAQGGSPTVLKAEVGGRILRATKDSFGVCALGAGNIEETLS